jgi:flagellar biosynthetic protein FliR
MQIPTEQLLSFLFVLARTSGIFVFTPFFGSLNIPAQPRIVLSVVISYLFALGTPLKNLPSTLNLSNLLIGILGELVVGMAIGFVAHALFAGLQYAGQIVGFQIGFSFVNAIDPQTASRSTTLSVFQNQLGLMLFLGLNAHHWFIRAIGTSLTVLPPFSIHIGREFIGKMVDLGAQIFVIGFQIAAPVTAVLLLTDVALGLIGRSAPQVHIMIIGFPLKVMVGIAAVGMGLYFFPSAMRIYTGHLQQDLETVIRLLRG